jgi:hypothetical protein
LWKCPVISDILTDSPIALVTRLILAAGERMKSVGSRGVKMKSPISDQHSITGGVLRQKRTLRKPSSLVSQLPAHAVTFKGCGPAGENATAVKEMVAPQSKPGNTCQTI